MINYFKTILLLVVSTFYAQDYKIGPTINVTGEGKIKVVPDQALVSISLETKGNKAKDVKAENDEKIDVVLKFIKKCEIAQEDFQTQQVSLYPTYDYEQKKHSYIATQSISVLIKDLRKYDELMDGIVNQGINRINNVEFKSSKMTQLQSEARKLAMQLAKKKAEDYVSVLGQKVGKAVLISDNSSVHVPRYETMMLRKADFVGDAQQPQETLAGGEIEITSNVTVSFALD